MFGFGFNFFGVFYIYCGWDVLGIVFYMESYDEEWLVYEALEFGSL